MFTWQWLWSIIPRPSLRCSGLCCRFTQSREASWTAERYVYIHWEDIQGNKDSVGLFETSACLFITCWLGFSFSSILPPRQMRKSFLFPLIKIAVVYRLLCKYWMASFAFGHQVYYILRSSVSMRVVVPPSLYVYLSTSWHLGTNSVLAYTFIVKQILVELRISIHLSS